MTAEQRVAVLEAAITRVVTQREDDLCWRDVYTELAHLVGVAPPQLNLSPEHMSENCARFIASLFGGPAYAKDRETQALCAAGEAALLLSRAGFPGATLPDAVKSALAEVVRLRAVEEAYEEAKSAAEDRRFD